MVLFEYALSFCFFFFSLSLSLPLLKFMAYIYVHTRSFSLSLSLSHFRSHILSRSAFFCSSALAISRSRAIFSSALLFFFVHFSLFFLLFFILCSLVYSLRRFYLKIPTLSLLTQRLAFFFFKRSKIN